jgi:hypothetical protein
MPGGSLRGAGANGEVGARGDAAADAASAGARRGGVGRGGGASGVCTDRVPGAVPGARRGKAETGAAAAEPILRRYLEETLASLGALREQAEELLENHLVTGDGGRTVRTEKELLQVLPAEKLGPILAALEKAAILHAEGHKGTRYFELGHDWLAKKVSEGRKQREEARRREEEARKLADARAAQRRAAAIAAIALVVAALMGVLVWWALGQRTKAQAAEEQAASQRDAARAAEKEATSQRDAAQRASAMASVRELFALGRRGRASMVLVAVKDPENARGWTQLATDLLVQGFPTRTLAHEINVYSAAWSPDGKRIVTASDDKTARVWNADSSGNPIVLKGHESEVRSAAWSPDGQRIVTTSTEKTARVWLFRDIPALQQALRDATTDCLTPEQRQIYLLESDADARAAYEACERSHGRTPFFGIAN